MYLSFMCTVQTSRGAVSSKMCCINYTESTYLLAHSNSRVRKVTTLPNTNYGNIPKKVCVNVQPILECSVEKEMGMHVQLEC